MTCDEDWMKRALELAERGRGHVEPNPLVGAVVVREGEVGGEGWHERFGAAHAEINALRQAGEAARGATLYVTLEPCCHHGKTPPCTDAVVAAGVGRVVAAMLDPFPEVAGRGAAQLRSAGIKVEVGVGEAEARRLNAPYLKLLGTGRPHVHAKWAMTLDGKIATRTGQSRWISNESSRQRVHALRGRMDAIVVGVGTVLFDNPELTARPPGPRVATRVVLDSLGRLPLHCNLVHSAREVPTLVVVCRTDDEPEDAHGPRSDPTQRRRKQDHARGRRHAVTGPPGKWPEPGAGHLESLRAAGCEILEMPGETRPEVLSLLDELGRRRMTNVLLEGGAEVLGSFVDEDAIDEYHVFISPRVAGGREARSAVGGLGVEKMADALNLARWEFETMDGDLYVHGWRR